MELSLVAIFARVIGQSPGQSGHGSLHGGRWDLSVATHQGLQDGVVDEGILILEDTYGQNGGGVTQKVRL